jgi:hypothetical protein
MPWFLVVLFVSILYNYLLYSILLFLFGFILNKVFLCSDYSSITAMNSLPEVISLQFFIKVRWLCYSRLFIPDWVYKADSSLNQPGAGRQALYRAAINRSFNLFTC